ncbi:MAG: polysaccharide biosynthesis tyrosine autokinase [Deltaproteobacteria bacterium]|nr:polysaccharide biosynthesis tyrosine autokinase [Deltaproteobacteria bacterium]
MELTPRNEDVHISDYLRVLFRRRYVALLSFLTVFVSVAIHTFLATPIYEAYGTIQIKDQSKKSLLSELVDLSQTNPVAAEIEILKSRSLAEEVVRQLKLDTIVNGFPYQPGWDFTDVQVGRALKGAVFTVTLTDSDGNYRVTNKDGEIGRGKLNEPFVSSDTSEKNRVSFLFTGTDATAGTWFRFQQQRFRAAVLNVLNRLNVQQVGDKTQILRIYFRHPKPQVAREVVNAIINTYTRRNIDENAREARETLKFIEGQRELVQSKLSESEGNLRDYKAEHGIMSLSEEATTVIQQYSKFAVEQANIQIEKQHYASILAAVKAGSEADFGLPSINLENSVLSNMSLTLAELQAKRQELLADLTPSHPDVMAIDAQIHEVKAKIADVLSSTITTLSAREKKLAGVLDEIGESLRGLPDKERDLAELVRARQVNSEIYTFLLQKREEARITEASTIGNIRTIDDAELPLQPISPNTRLNMMLGFVAGILLGIAVAFFLEFIDDSLKSTDEVERFVRQPIYGVIPRIPESKVIEDPDLPSPASANLVTAHSPKSPISEAFRTLRTNIHFAHPGQPTTEILITSASPSEGKSTIVANLALTIANTGKKTLIVDCDLRKPNVHNFFELSRDPGLTTIVTGEKPWKDVVLPTQIENLFVIPSGPIPPNPTELLESQAMRDLVDDFRANFDMILIDSPPVVPVTDAAILSSYVKNTLMVVELGRSRASVVNRAIDLLGKVNTKLLGLVTNNISTGYRYDYGYYTTYYYYASDGERKRRRKRKGRYGYGGY